MEEYEVEGGSAKFNSGIAKSQRIHEARKIINLCRNKPEAYYSEWMEFGDQLVWNNTNTILKEIESKLTKSQYTSCMIIKYKIDEIMKKFPLREEIKGINGKKEMRFSKENWEIIEKMFDIYGKKINDLADKHGFEMPNMDDSALF